VCNKLDILVFISKHCKTLTVTHGNDVTYHRVCNKSNTTGTTSGAETAYTSGPPEFTLSF